MPEPQPKTTPDVPPAKRSDADHGSTKADEANESKRPTDERRPFSDSAEAQREQDRQLETGEENPVS